MMIPGTQSAQSETVKVCFMLTGIECGLPIGIKTGAKYATVTDFPTPRN